MASKGDRLSISKIKFDSKLNKIQICLMIIFALLSSALFVRKLWFRRQNFGPLNLGRGLDHQGVRFKHSNRISPIVHSRPVYNTSKMSHQVACIDCLSIHHTIHRTNANVEIVCPNVDTYYLTRFFCTLKILSGRHDRSRNKILSEFT